MTNFNYPQKIELYTLQQTCCGTSSDGLSGLSEQLHRVVDKIGQTGAHTQLTATQLPNKEAMAKQGIKGSFEIRVDGKILLSPDLVCGFCDAESQWRQMIEDTSETMLNRWMGIFRGEEQVALEAPTQNETSGCCGPSKKKSCC